MLILSEVIEATRLPTVRFDHAPFEIVAANPSGANERYVRYTAGSHGLLEFGFRSKRLKPATISLKLLGATTSEYMIGPKTGRLGLPLFELPRDTSFDEARTIPMLDFEVSMAFYDSGNSYEIRVQEPGNYDESVQAGRLDFLFLARKLVGLRVNDISSEERSKLSQFL